MPLSGDEMIEKQDITLSLPKDLLREAQKIAVEQNTSLSDLMVDLLTQLVAKNNEYEAAKQRSLELMEEGRSLGLHGNITWTRDELHDRQY